jgi:hypothetical protein
MKKVDVWAAQIETMDEYIIAQGGVRGWSCMDSSCLASCSLGNNVAVDIVTVL